MSVFDKGRRPDDLWGLVTWLLVLAVLLVVLTAEAMAPIPTEPTAQERAARFAAQEEYYRVVDLYGDVEGAARGLRIAELWLACDTDAAIPGFKRAAEKLVKAGFSRDKIRCYCLIGDDMNRNEGRLREVYHAGAMPFAQLYRDFSDTKTEYDVEWNRFARMWQRPAAIAAHMERGTDYHDFGT